MILHPFYQLFFLVCLLNCTPNNPIQVHQLSNKKAATVPKTQTTQSKVIIKDIKEGQGKPVSSGQTVHVHYKASLEGSKETFDNSHLRKKPFVFTIGEGVVIPGFEDAVLGMKKGGKRIVTIPPSLGYGELGISNVIPPKQTLVFEIALLNIE